MFILMLLAECKSLILKRSKKTIFSIGKGDYEFNIYNLEYPEQLKEKEDFLLKLEKAMVSAVKEAKKLMILLNERFILDQLHIGEHGVLPEEMFIRDPASLLRKDQIETLLEALGVKDKDPTIQQLLNYQVKYILKFTDGDFDENRLYTELDKEKYLQSIFIKRRELGRIFKNKLISLFIELDSIYRSKKAESFEYRKHYYVKKISSGRKSTFGNTFNRFKDRSIIYIKDMKPGDLLSILSSEITLALDEYVVENEMLRGYAVRNSRIFLTGGEEEISEFKGLNITLNRIPTKVEDLLSVEGGYILSDLLKSKEKLEKEEEEYKKKVEKIVEKNRKKEEEKLQKEGEEDSPENKDEQREEDGEEKS